MLFSLAARMLPASVCQRLPPAQATACGVTGLLILLSIAFEPTCAAWREFDWMVYRLAQQLLAAVPSAHTPFALLNAHPLGNWLMDVAFVAVGLPWLVDRASRPELVRRLSLITYYALVWKITMSVVNRWFFGTLLDVAVSSPTIHQPPQVDLSQLFPDLHVKVFAEKTFPSDHAMQLLFLALVLGTMGRGRHKPAIAVCLFFCLPRMVSGAHWASDVVCGGLGVALVACAFWFGTPLCTWGMRVSSLAWSWVLGLPARPSPAQS
jgi:membrane-associated phospholipid phosphatase